MGPLRWFTLLTACDWTQWPPPCDDGDPSCEHASDTGTTCDPVDPRCPETPLSPQWVLIYRSHVPDEPLPCWTARAEDPSSVCEQATSWSPVGYTLSATQDQHPPLTSCGAEVRLGPGCPEPLGYTLPPAAPHPPIPPPPRTHRCGVFKVRARDPEPNLPPVLTTIGANLPLGYACEQDLGDVWSTSPCAFAPRPPCFEDLPPRTDADRASRTEGR